MPSFARRGEDTVGQPSGVNGEQDLSDLVAVVQEELPIEGLDSPLPPVDVKDLKKAAGLSSPSSGQGIDALSSGEISQLPDEAFQELIGILGRSEDVGPWPWQVVRT